LHSVFQKSPLPDIDPLTTLILTPSGGGRMELERDVLVSPTGEVPVIEGELVTAIRTLADRGVGKKTIAREVGVAVNTVRRYLRQPIEPGVQSRPAARRLTDEWRQEARSLYTGPAAGNAVVVQRLLSERGLSISVRTLERAVADIRREHRVAQLATVRVETAPGDQLQIDFGQKRLQIAGVRVRIFLLVAVLSYSRRLFVKAFLNERGDDWREGNRGGFHPFRRTAADAARRQCARVGARARPRDGHREFPPDLPRVLSRLGRAARVRPVARPDQR
jgi:transposase